MAGSISENNPYSSPLSHPPLSIQVKELLELIKQYNWPFTESDIPDICNLPPDLELGPTESLVLKIEFGSAGSVNSSQNSSNNLLRAIKDRGDVFTYSNVKKPVIKFAEIKPKLGVEKRISIIAYDHKANHGKSAAEVRELYPEDRLSSVEDILSVMVFMKDYLNDMDGINVPYAIASGCWLHSSSIYKLNSNWDDVVQIANRSNFVKTKLKTEDGLSFGRKKSTWNDPSWCCPLLRTIV